MANSLRSSVSKVNRSRLLPGPSPALLRPLTILFMVFSRITACQFNLSYGHFFCCEHSTHYCYWLHVVCKHDKCSSMIGFDSRDVAMVSSLICVLYDVGDVGLALFVY